MSKVDKNKEGAAIKKLRHNWRKMRQLLMVAKTPFVLEYRKYVPDGACDSKTLKPTTKRVVVWKVTKGWDEDSVKVYTGFDTYDYDNLDYRVSILKVMPATEEDIAELQGAIRDVYREYNNKIDEIQTMLKHIHEFKQAHPHVKVKVPRLVQRVEWLLNRGWVKQERAIRSYKRRITRLYSLLSKRNRRIDTLERFAIYMRRVMTLMYNILAQVGLKARLGRWLLETPMDMVKVHYKAIGKKFDKLIKDWDRVELWPPVSIHHDANLNTKRPTNK